MSRHMLLGAVSGRLGQVARTGLSKHEIATMHCTPLAQILKELPNGSGTKRNARRAAMAPKMRYDPSPLCLCFCLCLYLHPCLCSVSTNCLYFCSLFTLGSISAASVSVSAVSPCSWVYLRCLCLCFCSLFTLGSISAVSVCVSTVSLCSWVYLRCLCLCFCYLTLSSLSRHVN